MKKYIKWAFVILLGFFIFTQPQQAAGVAGNVVDGLQNIGTAAGTFVTNISSNF